MTNKKSHKPFHMTGTPLILDNIQWSSRIIVAKRYQIEAPTSRYFSNWGNILLRY